MESNPINIVKTIGEIPEGECFVVENQLYMKTARSARTYERIMSGLITEEREYFSNYCICVNLADGIIEVFRPDHPCIKVLAKVSLAPA